MIPLEDNVADIIGKAQRGLGLSDTELAGAAGVTLGELRAVRAGPFDERLVRALAPALRLGAHQLVALGQGTWYPPRQEILGLAMFTTPYGGMTVNAYLVWDLGARRAAAFDTGAECEPILQFLLDNQLGLDLILLTHSHGDHIGDLARLKQATGARAFITKQEPVEGVETFREGYVFSVGRLQIETRLTCGHTRSGTTYVVTGLERPVALTGDALFAGSMGGANVSYADALRTNCEQVLQSLPDDTILCPGHGPMTTVGEEKQHNPFFPELRSRDERCNSYEIG